MSQKALGLLIGLATGDRNGGPVQMALCLAESLAQLQNYSPADVYQRYYDWWQEGKGVDAWDTGPTTAFTLRQYRPGDCLQVLEDRSQALDIEQKGIY